MLLDRVAVALDQVGIERLVRLDMALEVHLHEAGQLDEAGIDPAREAQVRPRHTLDHVLLEPLDVVLLRELVDLGRVAARVDGTAHQRDRGRAAGVVHGGHARGRGEDRHRRLADGDDVGVGADPADEADDVVDEVVEVEAAEQGRDLARVAPVGDVEIVLADHRLDGAAEKRGIVRTWGPPPGPWAVALADHVRVPVEVEQVAEGRRLTIRSSIGTGWPTTEV